MRGNSRDLGLNHGAGKGSAPRYEHNESYRANHEAALGGQRRPIQYDFEFTQTKPGRYTKKYGRS